MWNHEAVAGRTAWPHVFVSDDVCGQNASCHLQAGYFSALQPWTWASPSTRRLTVPRASKARRFEMFLTTAPRLSLQIIAQRRGSQTATELAVAAGYIGRMITSPPVHEEKAYPNCLTLMTKEKSSRQPLGGSIGCGIYISTVTCQVERGTIWTYG